MVQVWKKALGLRMPLEGRDGKLDVPGQSEESPGAKSRGGSSP